MTIRSFLCCGAIALVATAAMACGFSTPQYIPLATPTLVPLPPDAVSVEMDIAAFALDDFEVEVGTWIVWNNRMSVYHRIAHTPLVLGEVLEFTGPEIAPPADDGGGGTYRYQFNNVGTFHYRCLIHASVMKAKIVVKERSGT